MCWSKPLQDGAQSFRSHLEAHQGSPTLQDSLNPSRPEPVFEAAAQKLHTLNKIDCISATTRSYSNHLGVIKKGSLVIFDQMCKSQYTRQWLSKNDHGPRPAQRNIFFGSPAKKKKKAFPG